MPTTPTTAMPRRLVALAVACTFVLATAAMVSGDEIVATTPELDLPAAVLQDLDEDEQERLENEAEDAQDRAEDEQEALEDELERQQQALEDEADDCAELEEGTHGWTVCNAAQAWKSDPDAKTPPADHGQTVSEIARDNHGAVIAGQKTANGGLPDAAQDALSQAGPTGDGPPGGGADDDEEEEEEEEED